jgi:hypothetical protein
MLGKQWSITGERKHQRSILDHVLIKPLIMKADVQG